MVQISKSAYRYRCAAEHLAPKYFSTWMKIIILQSYLKAWGVFIQAQGSDTKGGYKQLTLAL